MLKPHEQRRFGRHERVDVWLSPSRGTVPLSLNLVRYLTTADEWHRATIRFLVVNNEASGSDRLYATTRRLLDEARVDASVKVINNAMGARPFEEYVREESADADLTVTALPTNLNGGAEPWFARTEKLLSGLGAALLIRGSQTLDYDSIFGGGPGTTSTEEPLPAADDELEPLGLPDFPEAATETTRVADGLRLLLERFHERGVTDAYRVHGALIEQTRQAVDRFFAQLGRAVQIENPQRRAKAEARARANLVFRWRKLLRDFERTELEPHKTTLQHALRAAIDDAEAVKSRGLPLVVIGRPRADFVTPLAARTARQWGFEARCRIAAWLRRRTPTYGVTTRPVLAWVFDHRMRSALNETLTNIAEHGYELVLELSRVLELLRATRLRPRAEVDPERLEAEHQEIVQRFESQLDVARGRAGRQLAALRSESRAIARELSDDLSRIDVIRHVANERRVPRASTLLADRMPDAAGVITSNLALLLHRETLALTISGLQQRFSAVARRFASGASARANSGVLRQYERLREAVAEFARQLRAGEDVRLDVSAALPAPLDPRPLIDELVREVHQSLDETPDTLKTASDGGIEGLAGAPFDEADEIVLSVRRSLQFLIEAEFIGRMQATLAEIPGREQRAIDVAADVIRLIQFNQSDFEARDEIDDGVPLMTELLPVVENGLGRLDAELETLRQGSETINDEVERQLKFVLERTDAFAVSASPKPLLRYVSGDGQGVLSSTVGEGTRLLSQAARSVLAQVFYRRSEGVLLARRLQSERGATLVDRVLTLTRSLSPKPDVLQTLPFYYRQLFIGRSAFNQAMWVGRTEELERAGQAIDHFRAGFHGAILVVGERNSGKSALSHAIAHERFSRERTHHIYPPAGGSIDRAVFAQRLSAAVGISGDPRELLRSLPEQSVVVLHSLEGWWERSERGFDVIDLVLSLVEELSDRHLFLMNMDINTYRFVSRLRPVSDLALAVIECGPMDAQQLGRIVTLRHRSTGMRYALGHRMEENVPEWHRARMFAGLFDHSRGNVGAALQAWIAHVESVGDDAILVTTPTRPDSTALAGLSVEAVALLVQAVLHRTLTRPRLLRITGLEAEVLDRQLRALLRMGLMTEDAQGILAIDRYAWPCVLEQLQTRGVLP